MIIQDLKTAVLIYLAVLGLVFFLSIKFRRKFWILYSTVFFPMITIGLILFNLIRFPTYNRNDIPPSYQIQIEQLPSSELIDLFKNSINNDQREWVYILVEIYYQGRTLSIPNQVLGSLDISLEHLQKQGRIAEIEIIEAQIELTENRLEKILDLDFEVLRTQEGVDFYFVTELQDPEAPLLLLTYENKILFIPEDLLPDLEGSR